MIKGLRKMGIMLSEIFYHQKLTNFSIYFGRISAGWDFQRWNQKEQVVPDYCTRYLNLIPTLGLPKEKVKKKYSFDLRCI